MPPPGCNLSQIRGPAQQLQYAIDSFLCRVLWYLQKLFEDISPGGGTSTGQVSQELYCVWPHGMDMVQRNYA